jgi:hypothetical protein
MVRFDVSGSEILKLAETCRLCFVLAAFDASTVCQLVRAHSFWLRILLVCVLPAAKQVKLVN